MLVTHSKRQRPKMNTAPVAENILTLRMIQSATGIKDEDELLSATVLRLSWLGITAVDHLDLFDKCKDLYLQYNMLNNTLGFESLRNLEFLSLGRNKITRLEGLSGLTRLQVLDLTDNQIQNIEEGDLPPSIRIINVKGNPFASKSNYREILLRILPDCQCIDGLDTHLPAADVFPEMTEEEKLAAELEGAILDDDGDDDDLDGDDFGAQLDAELSKAVTANFPRKGANTVIPSLETCKVDTIDDSAAVDAIVEDKVREAVSRYAEKRAGLTAKFRAQLDEEMAKMEEMTSTLLSNSNEALGQATERLRSIRQDMVSRMQEREAAMETQLTATVQAFKDIKRDT